MLHQFFFSFFLFVLIKTLILNSHQGCPSHFYLTTKFQSFYAPIYSREKLKISYKFKIIRIISQLIKNIILADVISTVKS